MPQDAELTVREAAELAKVPLRTVNKAVEEEVIEPTRAKSARGRRPRKTLPIYIVPYAAVVDKLGVTLSRDRKRKLARTFKTRRATEMTATPVQIAPHVLVDVPKMVGDDLGRRVLRYVKSRERVIETNPEILGGTPVIRGTRISVYSLLGRLEHGDTTEAIQDDYPDLDSETIETAVTYARTHPLLGRPGGRPWLQQR